MVELWHAAPDRGAVDACSNADRDAFAANRRLRPPRFTRRGCGHADRVGWARHRSLRKRSEREEAHARIRATREDRLMTIRIRTTRDQSEFSAATAGIGHYFGGGWTPEEKERFAVLLPFERMHAAFDGENIVGGAGAFPFELSVPGGTLPCAGLPLVAVLPTHLCRGILGRMMRAQLETVHERGEPIAALWASEETIYGRFGYGLASQDVMIHASRVNAALHPGLPESTGALRLRRPPRGP